MPFAPESFDLITLNGVFEYIGLWGKGDPQALQEKFLRSALRLLRPNGYLYVGIETRFAAASFMGALDHSGHAYTTLMPHKIADWYCRWRSKPFYGSEHAIRVTVPTSTHRDNTGLCSSVPASEGRSTRGL